ncbi:MAG: cytochrome c-type biogenesis protein CcmH [Anaerolineae bacterium]|nr:cytochrome c-type biogenesis protein CcmH [Anaerolineae bacterium]
MSARLVMVFLCALVALTFALPAIPAAAQSPDFNLPPGVTYDDVIDVASEMECDVCEGIPLDECESVACREWREEIARQLGEGRSKNEILDYFVERYGADVATLPRSATDRFIAYAVPLGLALVLGVLGGMQVWQMRQRGQQAGQSVRRSGAGKFTTRPVPDDLDPALIERLQQELEGLD